MKSKSTSNAAVQVQYLSINVLSYTGPVVAAVCWLYLCSESVQQKFESLSETDVLVDSQRKLLALSFWLNKKNYNSQQALLWCLMRMSHTLITNREPLNYFVCFPVDVLTDVCGLQAVMQSRSAPWLTSETLTQQVSSAAPCILTPEFVAPMTNLWGNPAAPCWTENPTTPTARKVNTVCGSGSSPDAVWDTHS